MNTIIVKKKKAHRIGIRIITLLFAICFGIISFYFASYDLYYALLFLPWLVMILMLWLYYETWQIWFQTDGITKKVFFITGKKYSYHLIKDVVRYFANREGFYYKLVFISGKKMRFRLEDENADKAVKRIHSHHSIRILD